MHTYARTCVRVVTFNALRNCQKFYCCRSGVQFQQTDGGGSELSRPSVRLRLHHALREEHVFEGDVLGHDPADGSPWEEAA